MYIHYIRLGNKDLNNNDLINAFFSNVDRTFTYNSNTDIILASRARKRQVIPTDYTNNREVFRRYAWDGQKVIEGIDLNNEKSEKSSQIDLKTNALIGNAMASASGASVNAFTTNMMTAIKGIVDAGNTLKASVAAASNRSELEAVNDNR